MTYYTIWTRKKGAEDADLLDTMPLFKTKFRAMKRAKSVARRLDLKGDTDTEVLLRKITYGNEWCEEWVVRG